MKASEGKVLVVDDEAQIRNVCQRALEKLGFDVHAAESGDQAILLLDRHNYDFVLTDVSMPGCVDGPKLVEEIKNRSSSTDVVIMTAHPTLETAIRTLKHGAYDYLLKPFSLEYLESVVARCFEKRRLSKELDREKILRQELEVAYSELQKVERLKDAFLSRLQHELRTPLAKIIGVTEVVAEGAMGALGSARFTEILRSSTARMREVVEQLLLFADTHCQNLLLDRSPMDLEQAVKEVVENYASLSREKRLRVEISFGKMELLLADADLIKRAFNHLFLNAIHFNKMDGNIRIEGRQNADKAVVVFSDTGIGIPQNQLSNVFDSFYQVAEYMTRKVDGLGLGLAIVRRIVEAHGGKVSVRSQEGSGSTFTVSLPRHQINQDSNQESSLRSLQ